MSRVLDAVAPPRMGRSFRWLLASSWVTNIGDGLALAAGPLLVADQTDSAFLVALAALLQRLPWLLFGLWAGAIADRHDRRLLVRLANAVRAGVLVMLALAIVGDVVSIAVVLPVMFLLGTAETFADTATSTLVPMLVPRDDLVVANSRIQAGLVTANQLVGPPLGAVLYAAGTAVPFVSQSVLVLLGVVLVGRIAATPRVREGSGHLRRDVAEGFRWLLAHPPIRTLTLVIVTFNVTWGAAWSVLVLYARDHLGMGEVGYGLLTTAMAIGGVIATLGFDALHRRVPMALLMRVCLTLEVLTHLAFAVTTSGAVALVIMFVFGSYAFVWGAVSQAIRQRAVPIELQGRIASVYMVGVFLGIVIGQAIGGWIAEVWGLTAPFWFAFAGSGLTLALVWSRLTNIAHLDAHAAPSASTAPDVATEPTADRA
ncbi:MFS transporter [Desertimonas flava]|uniref:MFS transporter n=1 Tax=Desertimonas flava TaxID=2064846 RepID=UPI001968BBA0|nr:MFS transporter [Desertimonas flava]